MKKEENGKKPTRIISIYLKNRGIDTVLHECGNNLRAFRNHIRRVCNLPKSVKLYDVQQQAKKVLNNRLEEYGNVEKAVDKFLHDNFDEEL